MIYGISHTIIQFSGSDLVCQEGVNIIYCGLLFILFVYVPVLGASLTILIQSRESGSV